MSDCEKIIRNLKDEDWKERCKAVSELGSSIKPSDVENLMSLLENEKWYVRESVSEGLSSVNDKNVLKAVDDSLKTHRWFIPYGFRALIRAGYKPDITNVIDALYDDNPYVRCCAAETLGMIKDERALFALKDRLLDDNHPVRKKAAMAINKIRGNTGMPF
ncbi:MAG: HEAT repeat domain-containing protein [Methanomicrobium sp.]|nr:HEAT repeat domain-containing protein [Methanomicrobium sp.]MDD4300288.1 HEAT repeat domain-containing protein [Methanomicrobium sp.]